MRRGEPPCGRAIGVAWARRSESAGTRAAGGERSATAGGAAGEALSVHGVSGDPDGGTGRGADGAAVLIGGDCLGPGSLGARVSDSCGGTSEGESVASFGRRERCALGRPPALGGCRETRRAASKHPCRASGLDAAAGGGAGGDDRCRPRAAGDGTTLFVDARLFGRRACSLRETVSSTGLPRPKSPSHPTSPVLKVCRARDGGRPPRRRLDFPGSEAGDG